MAQGATALDYRTATSKPPLDMGVRLRLSIMMFLQFAVWGSWFTVWNVYLGGPREKGGLGFSGTQIGEHLRFAQRDWTVVGTFDAGGSGFDSEIWGDVDQLMQSFRRTSYSSMVVRSVMRLLRSTVSLVRRMDF